MSQDALYPADESQFQIPDLQIAQKQRERRRQAAADLIKQTANFKEGEMLPGFGDQAPVYASTQHNNQLPFLRAMTGQYLNSNLDKEEESEEAQLNSIRQELLKRMPADPSNQAALTRWGAEASQHPQLAQLGNAAFKEGIDYRKTADSGFTLGEGQQRYNSTGKVIAQGNPKSPTDHAPIAQTDDQGNTKLFDRSGKEIANLGKVGKTKAELQPPSFQFVQTDQGFQAVNPRNPSAKPVDTGLKPPEKPLTEAQGNALLFGTRAASAHNTLDEIGTNYNSMKTAIAKSAENVPGVNAAANTMLSGNEQKVIQAQRDFVNAILRKESGAAIAPSEFNNATKQYFPQVGDSKEVIAQKKRNRELAIKGLQQIAGPGGKAVAAEAGNVGKRTIIREVPLKDGRIGVEYSDGTRGIKQ